MIVYEWKTGADFHANATPVNKFQLNLNQNMQVFFKKILQILVCKMSSILFRLPFVNWHNTALQNTCKENGIFQSVVQT